MTSKNENGRFPGQTDDKGCNVIPLSERRKSRVNRAAQGLDSKRTILVVGADNTTLRIIQEIARQLKAPTHSADTSDQALDAVVKNSYALVIIFDRPPSLDAVHVIKLFAFLATGPRCKFCVLHDSPDWTTTAHVNDVDVDSHLQTPCNPLKLKNEITSLLNVAS